MWRVSANRSGHRPAYADVTSRPPLTAAAFCRLQQQTCLECLPRQCPFICRSAFCEDLRWSLATANQQSRQVRLAPPASGAHEGCSAILLALLAAAACCSATHHAGVQVTGAYLPPAPSPLCARLPSAASVCACRAALPAAQHSVAQRSRTAQEAPAAARPSMASSTGLAGASASLCAAVLPQQEGDHLSTDQPRSQLLATTGSGSEAPRRRLLAGEDAEAAAAVNPPPRPRPPRPKPPSPRCCCRAGGADAGGANAGGANAVPMRLVTLDLSEI